MMVELPTALAGRVSPMDSRTILATMSIAPYPGATSSVRCSRRPLVPAYGRAETRISGRRRSRLDRSSELSPHRAGECGCTVGWLPVALRPPGGIGAVLADWAAPTGNKDG